MTSLILLAFLALPPDHTALPQPCDSVRAAVQMLGVDGASAYARQQGWTAQQIDIAKRLCLGIRSNHK